MIDLSQDPARALSLCRAAEARLAVTAAALADEDLRAPSLLPGWSVGHVLTHLASNADGHARRVEGALRGESLGKYAGGAQQRRDEIEGGAHRPAVEVLADLRSSQARLLELFETADAAGWPHGDLLGGEAYPVTACPAHRLREVEMHHVDLGLSYRAADWPQDYVDWDVRVLLTTLPERLSEQDQRSLMAWVAGRGSVDPGWDAGAWG
ncbi:maleylpyruvate isomerase family mycothiol-dependent enzyme [Janibacter limosus]|jgi:maleylpyruvate isomerase|uniref:maleylpyruvate isomerase family mycothiol-dependent enzyme n=1 Tax=Janibacter limosus TaxID=53458 RepID=UPI00082E9E77|nr:maleylpyruvate isomerase family mycothiol-dependent enzyme [Janibacter limosus]